MNWTRFCSFGFPLTVLAACSGEDPEPLTPSAPLIVEMQLPDLVVDDPVDVSFSAMGGELPLTWALTEAIDGLLLSFDGRLSGSPAKSGAFTLGIAVRDARGREASAAFEVIVYERPTCGRSELNLAGGTSERLQGKLDRWLVPDACGEAVGFQAYDLSLAVFSIVRTSLPVGLDALAVGEAACAEPDLLCGGPLPEQTILPAGEHTLFVSGPRDGEYELGFEATEIGDRGSCEMPIGGVLPNGSISNQFYRPDPPVALGLAAPFYVAYRTDYTQALDVENRGSVPLELAVVRGQSCDGELLLHEQVEPDGWRRFPPSDTGMVFVPAGELWSSFSLRFHSYAGDGICANPRRVELDGRRAVMIDVDLRREAEQVAAAGCFVGNGFVVELVSTSTGSVELENDSGSTPVGFAVDDICPLAAAASCQEECIDFSAPGTRYVAIGPVGPIEQSYEARILFRPRSSPCD